jgi:hypothetical protein
MIMVEYDQHFSMITQHDHARLSGDIAADWDPEFFSGSYYKQEVLHAIYEHDRGWIDLDDTPFWNDKADAPYTFMDFPLGPKLVFYQKGVDEVKSKAPMRRYYVACIILHFLKMQWNQLLNNI